MRHAPLKALIIRTGRRPVLVPPFGTACAGASRFHSTLWLCCSSGVQGDCGTESVALGHVLSSSCGMNQVTAKATAATGTAARNTIGETGRGPGAVQLPGDGNQDLHDAAQADAEHQRGQRILPGGLPGPISDSRYSPAVISAVPAIGKTR